MENSVAGRVALEAKTSERGISAVLAVADEESADALNEMRPGIVEALLSGAREAVSDDMREGHVDLSIVVSKNLDSAAYVDNAPDSVRDEEQTSQQRNVQTRTLYNAAREIMNLLTVR